MNWEVIGAIGELVGAAAVVATLFYLARQIRQSNAHARRQEHNATMDQVSLLRMTLAQDPALVDVLLKGNKSYIGLTPNEKVRYDAALSQRFWNYLQIRDRVSSGAIEREYWYGTTALTAASLLTEGALEWWRQNNRQYPKEFVQEIDKLLSEVT